MVFAERIGADLARALPPRQEPTAASSVPEHVGLLTGDVRPQVAATMTEGAGVLRSEDSLAGTEHRLTELGTLESSDPCTETWEATNLHTVASFLVAAARLRQETRGSHWREDFPDRDDEHWHGRLVGRLVDGHLDLRLAPVDGDKPSEEER